jgi:hypothetical protein
MIGFGNQTVSNVAIGSEAYISGVGVAVTQQWEVHGFELLRSGRTNEGAGRVGGGFQRRCRA